MERCVVVLDDVELHVFHDLGHGAPPRRVPVRHSPEFVPKRSEKFAKEKKEISCRLMVSNYDRR